MEEQSALNLLGLRRLEVLGHNLPVKSITPKCITRDAQTMHLGVITQSEHDQGLPKAPAENANSVPIFSSSCELKIPFIFFMDGSFPRQYIFCART